MRTCFSALASAIGFLAMLSAGARAADELSGVVVLGGGMLPDYEGSEDYQAIPFGYLNLRYGPWSLDVPGPKAKFGYDVTEQLTLGIVGSYIGERDAISVVGARQVDDTFGAGAFIAYDLAPGLSQGDSLLLGLEGLADVGGETDGYTVSPSLAYTFFAGRAVRMSFDASAQLADDNHMSSYFDAAGFSADGGLKSATLGMTATLMFSEHLGFSARAAWTRLLGDAADSPVTESDDQFLLGGGLTFRF